MGQQRRIYKVIFLNQGQVYELFAEGVSSSGLMGFVEVTDLIFAESGVVIDPVEDRIRSEFENAKSLHLPMHSVIRVEEVRERGTCKIREGNAGENVTTFPVPNLQRNPKS